MNARAGWTGHLFQGRFASVVLDEEYLTLAARAVALDPVRARLVQGPQGMGKPARTSERAR